MRRTLESGRLVWRRARGPVGQPPPDPVGGSSVPRGSKDAATPGGFAEVRQ